MGADRIRSVPAPSRCDPDRYRQALPMTLYHHQVRRDLERGFIDVERGLTRNCAKRRVNKNIPGPHGESFRDAHGVDAYPPPTLGIQGIGMTINARRKYAIVYVKHINVAWTMMKAVFRAIHTFWTK